MVTRAPEELDEMRRQIAAGDLPADAIEKYYEEERRNVFGHDHKTDAKGNPIEQGIGSKGRESLNHFNAMLQNEQRGVIAPGTYKAAISELWKRDPTRAEKLGLQRL
jgi:hypothetical protein